MTIGKLTITFWRPRGRYQWIALVIAYALGIGGLVLGSFGAHWIRDAIGMSLIGAGYRIVDRIEELPK